jgi:phenylpropionate dioxygenase-like ring-hydroxylating dioxygenase large terminal subunit
MSDLSLSREALERSRSQLPVSSYFDAGLFREEQVHIFSSAPRYLGHALALPERGDYLALKQEDEGRALVHNASGIELVSNVCRHRQAIMLQGRGNTGGHIVCPLHRWTYDLHGKLVGAPHFSEDPCLSLKRLAKGDLQQWQGLVFEAPGRPASTGLRHVATDLKALGVAAELDFTGFQFHSARVHECAYNWKSFIEVYLEDYHVGPFHPGLGRFVSCDDLRWEMGPHHSVQTVGVHHELERPGSETYQRWHDAVLKFRSGEPPAHGAIWLTLYPTTMVEWYPHVLVVSSLHPRGPQDTLNLVEFFYPEEIVAFEPDFIAAQQAAYMETCAEDDEIALRMDAGRRALMRRGDDEAGPYQSPMEDGMQHFHEWYRREMSAAAPTRVPLGTRR